MLVKRRFTRFERPRVGNNKEIKVGAMNNILVIRAGVKELESELLAKLFLMIIYQKISN